MEDGPPLQGAEELTKEVWTPGTELLGFGLAGPATAERLDTGPMSV